MTSKQTSILVFKKPDLLQHILKRPIALPPFFFSGSEIALLLTNCPFMEVIMIKGCIAKFLNCNVISVEYLETWP